MAEPYKRLRGEDAGHDGKRSRELFRYIRATSSAVGYADKWTPGSQLTQSDQQPSQPQLSSDISLTALTQLGVHKIGVDRAFISLIDGDSQTVIAEATRSISLFDNALHQPDDQLWMGHKSLSLKFGITPEVVKCFVSNKASRHVHTPNKTINSSRAIILDVAKDPKYKDKPYINTWPYIQFYAAVPLTSPSGYVLGAYIVCDKHPKQEFTDHSISQMQEIATAVTRHLDFVGKADQLGRGERLLQAVNLFVEGQSSLRSWSINEFLARDKRRTSENAHAWADEEYGVLHDVDRDHHHARDTSISPRTSPARGSSTQDISHNQSGDNSTSTGNPQQLTSPGFTSGHSNFASQVRETSMAPQHVDTKSAISNCLARASNLLREAMQLEGMMFLDAAVSSVEGATYSHHDLQSKIEDMTETSLSTESRNVPNMARHLGFSTRVKSSLANNELAPTRHSIPEELMQYLLVQYPHGCVLHFDGAGIMSSSSDDDRLLYRPRKARKLQKLFKELPLGYAVDTALMNAFPGVNSLIFCPLWDNQTDSWFGGGFGWTTDSKRSLSADELTYVTAFVNSLMAEVSRLEISETDRAKSDFISSISHELRSPLHGILGSSELLADELSNSKQEQLLQMIQKCATTLLDTMNHLLDYAKINSLARRVSAPELEGPSRTNSMQAGGGVNLMSTFDLSSMVEDLTEGILVGHGFKTIESDNDTPGRPGQYNAPQPPAQTAPVCTLTIARQSTWFIRSEPGAWRRIVQNLLGNAFKYTKEGHVEVKLEVAPAGSTLSNSTLASDTVIFYVRDTGQGISQHYLENFLYKPFAQEDALSVGTGLGLSIVKQIVTSLGGQIHIKSKVKVGTEITVAIPVEFSSKHHEEGNLTHVSESLTNMKLSLLDMDFSSPSDGPLKVGQYNQSPEQRSAVTRCMETHGSQWFNLEVRVASPSDPTDADFVVVQEDDLELLRTQYQDFWTTLGNRRSIILCRGSIIVPASKVPSTWNVQYISAPYGPKRMSQALSAFQNNVPQSHQFVGKEEITPNGPTSSKPASSLSTRTSSMNLESQDPMELDPKLSPVNQTKKLHILCVDDNSINLNMLTTCMKRLDCTYEKALNGSEAVEAFRTGSQTFDYIFMDISMPVMDGFTASREIRLIEREQSAGSDPHRTTIIALTGLGSEKAQDQARASGVDLFLTKPVPMKKLREVLFPAVSE